MANVKKDDVDVKALYGNDCVSSSEDFKKAHGVSDKGLSSKTAMERLKNLGPNQIKQAKQKKWYNYFFASLFSPFNSILLGITFILVYTDIILPENPSPANIIVIALLIIVSTLLEFIEVFRSNKAAEKLKELVETTSTVIRNGKKITIPLKEVTVGDMVILSAGDMIPADLRIIESKDLYVGQSSITGESDAVRKLTETELESIDDIDSITDLDTICFMGTNVISGSAKGIVIKSGDSTYFGKVAHTLSLGKPKTNFQKGIESISKLLIKFMLVLIPLVFIVNYQKHNTVLAFTFAVAIAITITPLLLPVILSSCLSKGAVRMSKKKTIVKKLDSIQNFGAMNILCTDKTGTLTKGIFKVSKINSKVSDLEFLKVAVVAEIYSNHPIAKSIMNLKNEKVNNDDVKKYQEIEGKGITFELNDKKISIGNKLICNCEEDAILHLNIDGKHIASVFINDGIKNDAKETIEELKKQKIKTFMFTGDKKETALNIGKKLNIDEIKYEMLPTDKFEEFEKVSSKNELTIFVGDGINDAPVLKRADIGISMGGVGTDSAIEASDIVLMSDDLKKIPVAIQISKYTKNIIRQNLVFSISMKIIILLLSVLGFANMWLAVFADTGLTLLTILNTLRIMKRFA